MKLRVKRSLAAIALAMLLAAAIVCQAQQPASDQAPPDATAPQTTTPQPENPPNAVPGEDKQAPPEKREDQAAPEHNQPSPPNESTPPPQQAPAQKQAPESPPTKPATTGKTPKSKSGKIERPKKRKGVTAGSKTPAPATSGDPGKVVVRNGGAKDNAIRLSPGGTHEQELHTRENTAQLLTRTDANLKRVAGRQLTSAEQSTVDQIHAYIRQSKLATDSGDLARAHTLAFKAHLLSDDLAKR